MPPHLHSGPSRPEPEVASRLLSHHGPHLPGLPHLAAAATTTNAAAATTTTTTATATIATTATVAANLVAVESGWETKCCPVDPALPSCPSHSG